MPFLKDNQHFNKMSVTSHKHYLAIKILTRAFAAYANVLDIMIHIAVHLKIFSALDALSNARLTHQTIFNILMITM